MKKRWSVGALVFGVLLFQALSVLRGGDLLGVAHANPGAGAHVEVLGVYFSPPAGSAAAIVKAVDASQHEVLVQAYSFTHNAIAQAVLRAHARGVTVRVLLDQKSEQTNRYVLELLRHAHVPLRGDGQHAIAHNKVMVIDDSVVITGSFNFTNAAETRNAENFLILKSPDLARIYKSEWEKHWAHGAD